MRCPKKSKRIVINDLKQVLTYIVCLGLRIELNGRKVNSKSFEIEKKKLFITSPPKPNQDDQLRVTIKQVPYVGDSSPSKANILYDDYLEYVSNGTNKV